jgi:hypothetical protein
MPDRRRDKRFRLTERPEGTMKWFLDVIMQPHGKGEWLAIAREPVPTGETLMLDVVVHEPDGCELWERIPVCVIDSRAVILDGDLRYRIRLLPGNLAPVLYEPAWLS